MPRLPREPSDGDEIRAPWARDVVKYIKAITPVSSPGILVRTLANGTSLVPTAKTFQNSTTQSTPCEAFTINVTEVADPNYTVLLTPGTINQAVPSNILTPIAYVDTTDRYVKLKVTTDGYALTGVTVALEATPTDPIGSTADAGPTSFDILIGVISQGVVTQVWNDCNITATLTLSLVESKVTPVPGTSPYTFYYTWVITGG